MSLSGNEKFEGIEVSIIQSFLIFSAIRVFLPSTYPPFHFVLSFLSISHFSQSEISPPLLPSKSLGLSWSFYFSYSLFSHHSLLVYLTDPLSVSTPDFTCTVSARDRTQEQHVFFEFYFSLWHQTHIKQIFIQQE